MAKDSDILKDAHDAFKLADDHESENRADALDDLRFGRLGEQWPVAILKKRELEGRPCLTINRLPAFMRQVVNDARQNKPSIKCHPADSKADPPTATIMNGLIRNIEYASNADVAYDTAAEFAVACGFGYWRVTLDYCNERSFDMDIRIDAIPNPFSVYGDPHATGADSSDWNSAFVTELMERDAFEAKYKGAKPVDWDAGEYSRLKMPWMDGKKVLTAEWWKREQEPSTLLLLSNGLILLETEFEPIRDLLVVQGITVVKQRDSTINTVKQYILTGAEVLDTVDWVGRFIPIIPVYGDEVNVEGKRHFRSLIRDAKDPQRMFNYWRTMSTELMALAPKTPFTGPVGSFTTDADKWATANTDSHPFIEYDIVPGALAGPQRQQFAGPPAGALQEALNASDDMKTVMGLYDASLGARSNETSGRAIMARQREGDVSTFHFIDNVRRSIRHTGRILIDLIPKVYTGQRVVRVLGQDGKTPQNVQLGKLEQQPPAPPQAEGQPAPDPVQRIYDLGLGEYDLTVETGPSFTTQREEATNAIIEMVRAYPAAAPLVMDILAKNMDWPGADEIAKRMEAVLPPQVKGQNPQVMAMQQAGQKLVQENEALKADKSLDMVKAKAESDKVLIGKYQAETERMKVLGVAPETLPLLLMQLVREAMATPLVPTAPGPMPAGPGGPSPFMPPQPGPPQPTGGFGGLPPGAGGPGVGGGTG